MASGPVVIEESNRFHQMPPDIPGDLRRLMRKAERKGHPVIDLTRDEVEGLDPFPPLQKSFDKDRDGSLSVNEFICRRYAEQYRASLNPRSEVLPVADIRRLPRDICLAFVNPGDPVLVPDPGPSSFRAAAVLAGGEPVPFGLFERNDFLPNLQAVPSRVAHDAKVMFLNYPHNPTGALADLGFFDELVAFARKYNLILVHDATYGPVVFDEHQPLSLMQAGGARRLALEYGGFNRPFGPEWDASGYLVGNRELISGIDTLIAGHGGSGAARMFLDGGIRSQSFSPGLAELVADLEGRRDLVLGALREMGWIARRPHGSPFVWLKLPGTYSSIGFVRMCLRRTSVALMPGAAFGENGEGWVRLSAGARREELQTAVERLAADALLGFKLKGSHKRRKA